MAKVIKSINQIRLSPDVTGLAFGVADFAYTVSSSDDDSLIREVPSLVLDLSAFTGSPADMMAACLSAAETNEGI